MSAARVEVLYPDIQTSRRRISTRGLFRQLRTQGTPIPTNDLWTGALAVQHGLHLFARDHHFDQLPQVPRV